MKFFVDLEEESEGLMVAVVTLDGEHSRFVGHRKPEKSLAEAKKFILKRIADVLAEIDLDFIPGSVEFIFRDKSASAPHPLEHNNP